MVIGLTGGIACGKTTIAKRFQELGAEIIDVDAIGHHLLRNDPSVYKKVIEEFGCDILNEKGEIDRSKLGQIVFNNYEKLKILNQIIHPQLIELTKEMIAKSIAEDKNKIILVDAALLIELNLIYMVDKVILAYVDEDTQVQRLIQRGMSYEEAFKRIRSQMPSSEKMRFADFIIHTSCSLKETIDQVDKVWKEINCEKLEIFRNLDKKS